MRKSSRNPACCGQQDLLGVKAPYLAVGTGGCCSCHCCHLHSLSIGHTPIAVPHTLCPGRTLWAHKGLRAQRHDGALGHACTHGRPRYPLMFHGGAQALFSIDTADGSQTPKILCLPQTGPMRQQGCWSYHTPLTEGAINLCFLQCGPSHLSPCPENMPSIFSPLSGSM